MTTSKSPFRGQLLGVFGCVLGVGSLAGCSDLRDEFSESVCTNDKTVLLDGLKTSQPFDYLALRTAIFNSPAHEVVEEFGACPSTAPCEQLNEPVPKEGMRPDYAWNMSQHLAVVREDKVELVMTVEEVKAFLGTIDTSDEAALLVHLSGYNLDCEGPNLTSGAGQYLVYAQRGSTCGGDVRGFKLLVEGDGSLEVLVEEVVEYGDDTCVIGRVPAGLLPVNGRDAGDSGCDPVGAYFAEVAHLEAAAVAAFDGLAEELMAHGAPSELVADARRAARQETRHAVMTGTIARRYGRERSVPEVQSSPVRTLLELAIDNAVEGLTRETFGALLGHHQALHAEDPAVRRAMEVIASDETDHAEFSWRLHHWLLSQLSPAERLEVQRAREGALERFGGAMLTEADPRVQRLAGLPDAAQATQLFRRLFSEMQAMPLFAV